MLIMWFPSLIGSSITGLGMWDTSANSPFPSLIGSSITRQTGVVTIEIFEVSIPYRKFNNLGMKHGEEVA